MSDDLIKRKDAIKAFTVNSKGERLPYVDCNNFPIEFSLEYIVKTLIDLPTANRPKHYCAECKFEPIDKRCMPCSSCTNNPKNRDAFVSCEVEKKGADDE